MTKRLDAVRGTVEFDNLINSNDMGTKQEGVTIEAGEGKLKKGTLLSKRPNGKMVILGTGTGYVKVTNSTANALKVVASGAETGEINLADVTPVKDATYTPAATDYVIFYDAGKADCILNEDIDATSADVNAVAYVKGDFNENHLIVKEGYTLTEADRDVLRTKNILLGKSIA